MIALVSIGGINQKTLIPQCFEIKIAIMLFKEKQTNRRSLPPRRSPRERLGRRPNPRRRRRRPHARAAAPPPERAAGSPRGLLGRRRQGRIDGPCPLTPGSAREMGCGGHGGAAARRNGAYAVGSLGERRELRRLGPRRGSARQRAGVAGGRCGRIRWRQVWIHRLSRLRCRGSGVAARRWRGGAGAAVRRTLLGGGREALCCDAASAGGSAEGPAAAWCCGRGWPVRGLTGGTMEALLVVTCAWAC